MRRNELFRMSSDGRLCNLIEDFPSDLSSFEDLDFTTLVADSKQSMPLLTMSGFEPAELAELFEVESLLLSDQPGWLTDFEAPLADELASATAAVQHVIHESPSRAAAVLPLRPVATANLATSLCSKSPLCVPSLSRPVCVAGTRVAFGTEFTVPSVLRHNRLVIADTDLLRPRIISLDGPVSALAPVGESHLVFGSGSSIGLLRDCGADDEAGSAREPVYCEAFHSTPLRDMSAHVNGRHIASAGNDGSVVRAWFASLSYLERGLLTCVCRACLCLHDSLCQTSKPLW